MSTAARARTATTVAVPVLGGRGDRNPASLSRSIISTYGARAATLVAYVALVPIVLHSVGAEAYGLYALTVALGAIFQQDLGIGDATTRFIAVARPTGDVTRMRVVAAASAGFSLLAAVIMGAAVAASLALTISAAEVPRELRDTAGILVALGAANVFLLLALAPARQVLGGIGRLDEVNILLIGQAALRVALTIAVCAAGGGILAVAAVDLLATVALGLASLWLRRRRAPLLTVSLRDFSWPVFRELFSMSSALMVIGLAAVVVTQIGGILTALLLPIAFTALFSAGQRMYLIVKEITASLATAILPIASMNHRDDDHTTHRNLYLVGTGYANMLMVLVLVPAVLFMPLIIEAWIGSATPVGALAAALVAQILIVSLFANNNHLLALPILTAQGHVRPYAILHSVWAISGTALATVLGAHLGLPGIALGIVAPIVVLEPIYVAVALRRVGARPRDFALRCLVRPLVPALPLAIALALLAAALSPNLGGAVLLSLGWGAGLIAVYTVVDAPLRRGLHRGVRRILSLSLSHSSRPGRSHGSIETEPTA